MDPEASVPDGHAVAFECSGRDGAFWLLQRKLGTGGRLCVLSDGNLEPLVLRPEFHEKELSIFASSDGWDYRQHARWYFDVVRDVYTGLEDIFDLHTTVKDLPHIFEAMAQEETRPIKVLIDYEPPARP